MRGFVLHITNNLKEMKRKISQRVADLFSTIFLFKDKKEAPRQHPKHIISNSFAAAPHFGPHFQLPETFSELLTPARAPCLR